MRLTVKISYCDCFVSKKAEGCYFEVSSVKKIFFFLFETFWLRSHIENSMKIEFKLYFAEILDSCDYTLS